MLFLLSQSPVLGSECSISIYSGVFSVSMGTQGSCGRGSANMGGASRSCERVELHGVPEMKQWQEESGLLYRPPVLSICLALAFSVYGHPPNTHTRTHSLPHTDTHTQLHEMECLQEICEDKENKNRMPERICPGGMIL